MSIIYLCDISQVTEEDVTLLTPSRREKMMRYRSADERLRSLTAGLMLRSVLGEETAEKILSAPLGKPYLEKGPHFNLSHSGDKVALLVDEEEVGVDIEKIRPHSAAVSRRFFTEGEKEWLKEQEEPSAFFRLWTGKESIMKAVGEGFHLSPLDFELHPHKAEPVTLRGRVLYPYWIECDGYMLCYALSHTDEKTELITLTGADLLR